MRKIILSPYFIGEDQQFDVKGSIYNAMYHPSLALNGSELLRNDIIAKKIKESTDSVVLEDYEYAIVVAIFNTIRGFNENDTEMLKRIYHAEEVE